MITLVTSGSKNDSLERFEEVEVEEVEKSLVPSMHETGPVSRMEGTKLPSTCSKKSAI